MKRNFIVSFLALLFIGTVAFAQVPPPTIYSPVDNAVIEYMGYNTNNVKLVFNDEGNGILPGSGKYYRFDVYVNGVLYVTGVQHSPCYLSLDQGNYTITIVVMCRSNLTQSFVNSGNASANFTVINKPDMEVSASSSYVGPNQQLNFSASWNSNHISSEVGWDIKYDNGPWTTIYNYGASYSLSSPGNHNSVTARIWIKIFGYKVYSNECTVYIN